MRLFDILQDGYHNPLTATQIAELFYAGRVGRSTPCKPAEHQQWHTIDELFPLLKYYVPWQSDYQSPVSATERRRQSTIVALCLVGAAVATLTVYLCFQADGLPDRSIKTIGSTSSPAPLNVPNASLPSTETNRNTVTPFAAPRFSGASIRSQEVPAQETAGQSAVRVTEATRIEEQARRDLAAAEQQRLLKQQILVEQQKAAGTDQHLLLDHWQTVNVGGYSVSVKIHDNDTTSFDVWINGERRRDVKKEKGISGTRTDETLIYSNGRASLYYVWEISGRLDHCLLRVRED